MSNEFRKFVECHFLVILKIECFNEFGEVDVVGVDFETQFCHYHFELVLKLLIELRVLLEITFENRMLEHFIPRHTILLPFL